MDTSIFRAYDIRGKYPDEINEDVAFKIGQAYGSYIQEKLNQSSCVVSRDNRLSSESLTSELIRGILSVWQISDKNCNVGICTQRNIPLFILWLATTLNGVLPCH